MGREIRRVPKGWEHPRDNGGSYIPLNDEYNNRVSEWDAGNAKWLEGLRSDYSGGWKPIDEQHRGQPYAEWDGDRPVAEDYMPEWAEEEKTQLMMYETTTEGTPISPAFATPEELARWLADTEASSFGGMTATYEQWLSVCRGGWAPGAVMDAKGFRSGVEAMSDS